MRGPGLGKVTLRYVQGFSFRQAGSRAVTARPRPLLDPLERGTAADGIREFRLNNPTQGNVAVLMLCSD